MSAFPFLRVLISRDTRTKKDDDDHQEEPWELSDDDPVLMRPQDAKANGGTKATPFRR